MKCIVILILCIFSIFSLGLNQNVLGKAAFHHCPPLCYELETVPPTYNLTAPIVNHPTSEELTQYLNESGTKEDFNPIANSSDIGVPSDYQIRVIDKYQNLVWLAFIGTLEGNGNVYIQRSSDGGHDFENLTLLSNSTAGSARNLQFDTSDDGRLIYAVWENMNNSTNKSSIYVSSSMDAGYSFKTYSLNYPEDGNATNPIIEIIDNNLLILWTQEPPSHGTEGGHTEGVIIDSHGRRW